MEPIGLLLEAALTCVDRNSLQGQLYGKQECQWSACWLNGPCWLAQLPSASPTSRGAARKHGILVGCELLLDAVDSPGAKGTGQRSLVASSLAP